MSKIEGKKELSLSLFFFSVPKMRNIFLDSRLNLEHPLESTHDEVVKTPSERVLVPRSEKYEIIFSLSQPSLIDHPKLLTFCLLLFPLQEGFLSTRAL